MESLLGGSSRKSNREHVLRQTGALRHIPLLHCKEPIPKIGNIASQERNCATTVPISTFMCLSDLYISTIDLPILLQEKCGPILGIYKSLTDTCRVVL